MTVAVLPAGFCWTGRRDVIDAGRIFCWWNAATWERIVTSCWKMGLLLYVAPADGRDRELPEEESYDCVCSCSHSECVPLRRRCWCRHWVIVHWVTRAFLDPPMLMQKIRDCLRDGAPIEWCGSFWPDAAEEHHYRILLLVDPAGPGFGDAQLVRLSDPEGCHLGVGFVRDASFVSRFRCCKQHLGGTIPGWIVTMRCQRLSCTTLSFGDEELLDQLDVWMQLDGVRRAASP